MDSDVFHRDSKLTLVPIPPSEQQQQDEDEVKTSQNDFFDEKYDLYCLATNKRIIFQLL